MSHPRDILRFCFRNVLRSRRRSGITFALVVFCSFLITAFRFLAYGMHQEALWNAVGLTKGFVQVAAYGWLQNPTIERALSVDQSLLRSLRLRGVRAVSPRLEAMALAAHGDDSAFVSVFAADSALEEAITTFHAVPVEGMHLRESSALGGRTERGYPIYRATLGRTLADNLQCAPGCTITLVTNQFDGSVGAITVVVVGIFRSMDGIIDATRINIPVEAGRELLGVPVQENGSFMATSLAIGIEDYLLAGEVYRELRVRFPPPEGDRKDAGHSREFGPVAHFWPELIPGLVQMMALDDVQNNVSWAFLILIMAFGVLGSAQMSIQERTRELGVLLALGMRRGLLAWTTLLETGLILVPGMCAGALLGSGAASYLYTHPLTLSGEMAAAYAAMGLQAPRIIAIVDVRELWVGLLSLFLPAAASVLLAARRLYTLEPARILSVG